MRDLRRDEESTERWATYADADLIRLAKTLNHELLKRTRALVDFYTEDDVAQAAAVAEQLTAARYELARRRIPNPSGAPTVAVYQGGQGANIASSQTIGENHGTAAGVEIGRVET